MPRPYNRIRKVCEICCAPFEVKASRSQLIRTCSRKCGDRLRVLNHRRDLESKYGMPLKDLLVNMHFKKGMGVQLIANQLDVGFYSIKRWFKEFGIMCQKYYWQINPSQSDAVREKIRQSKLGKKNPMYGKYGHLNPNWKGGKVTYRGAGWRGIILQVKRRDGYRCTRCGTDRYLQVHHIIPYRETRDNSLENLTTLCATCHAIVENKAPNKNPRVNQWG